MHALTPSRVAASLLFALLATTACSDDDPSGPSGPPGGLTVTIVSLNEIQVSWNTVSGATGYIVERAEGSGSFAEVATPATTSYTDTDVEPGNEYRYRVAATNDHGTTQFSSAATATSAIVISTNITSNMTLTKNNTYLLRGFIRVANGATLTIEAGTVIKGDFDTPRTALVVLRGARIVANGTAAEPIVFTSSREPGQRQPGDWGGLAIIGNGVISRSGQVILEGTDQSVGGAIEYSGGTSNDDNSGTLRYVRVEFAGYELSPGNELNSYTFAAVGRGTTLEYLQAMAGLDDHYEWFGGAVDGKYLVSYESGDDHFDMSEGFQGRLQHLIAYQSKILVPRPNAGSVSSDPQGIENDGCTSSGCDAILGEATQPYTQPLVANFTLVGRGVAETSSREIGMVLRRGTAGVYVNGHITRWQNFGIGIRETTGSTAQIGRITDGSFVLSNILVSDGGAIFETGSGRLTVPIETNAITLASATTTASLFSAFSTDPNSASQLDWSPSAGAAQRTGGTGAFSGAIATRAGTFATGTAYRGAADPNGPKWWQGWTIYADN